MPRHPKRSTVDVNINTHAHTENTHPTYLYNTQTPHKHTYMNHHTNIHILTEHSTYMSTYICLHKSQCKHKHFIHSISHLYTSVHHSHAQNMVYPTHIMHIHTHTTHIFIYIYISSHITDHIHTTHMYICTFTVTHITPQTTHFHRALQIYILHIYYKYNGHTT